MLIDVFIQMTVSISFRVWSEEVFHDRHEFILTTIRKIELKTLTIIESYSHV